MNNNIKYLNPQNKPKTAAGVGCTRLELWLVDLPKPDNDTHVQYGVRPVHATMYGAVALPPLSSVMMPRMKTVLQLR